MCGPEDPVQTARQEADLCQPVDRRAFLGDSEGSGPLRPVAEEDTPPVPGEKAQHRLNRSRARRPGRRGGHRDVEIDLAGPAVLSVQLSGDSRVPGVDERGENDEVNSLLRGLQAAGGELVQRVTDAEAHAQFTVQEIDLDYHAAGLAQLYLKIEQ